MMMTGTQNMNDVKIVSGSFSYCCKRSRELAKEGYVLIDQKRWSDGKFSFKFVDKRKVSA